TLPRWRLRDERVSSRRDPGRGDDPAASHREWATASGLLRGRRQRLPLTTSSIRLPAPQGKGGTRHFAIPFGPATDPRPVLKQLSPVTGREIHRIAGWAAMARGSPGPVPPRISHARGPLPCTLQSRWRRFAFCIARAEAFPLRSHRAAPTRITSARPPAPWAAWPGEARMSYGVFDPRAGPWAPGSILRDLALLLVGWVLGIVASPVTDAIRRRSAKQRLTRALRTELRSLQDTLAWAVVQIDRRRGVLTP